MRILLVDDEQSITRTLGDHLREQGHRVDIEERGDDALTRFEQGDTFYHVVIADLKMPGLHGMELLDEVTSRSPDTEVITITGHETGVETAVEAMKKGAFHYFTKPFKYDEIDAVLDRIEELQELRQTRDRYEEVRAGSGAFEQLVGQSQAIREVFDTIKTLSSSEATVLIRGESGTGKELVAESLHRKSPRSEGPLVKFSCAGVPENLVDAELFGYEEGAFTGASGDHEGRFERADGGTLFLDDIDDMARDVQSKFLRVLQEQEIERLGGEEIIDVDVRVITSTKRDLQEMVEENAFREDLFYRLNVVPVYLPPLRERKDDIPLLVEHFIEKHGDGNAYTVSPSTMEAMRDYDWPGNVRELENVVQRAIALAGEKETLKREHLLPEEGQVPGRMEGEGDTFPDLDTQLDHAREKHIRRALDKTEGSRNKAADLLGISRKTLWKYMKEYNIDQDRTEES